MTIKKLFAYSHTAVLNKPIQELYERSWGKKMKLRFGTHLCVMRSLMELKGDCIVWLRVAEKRNKQISLLIVYSNAKQILYN